MKYLRIFDHFTKDWYDQHKDYYLSKVGKPPKEESSDDKLDDSMLELEKLLNTSKIEDFKVVIVDDIYKTNQNFLTLGKCRLDTSSKTIYVEVQSSVFNEDIAIIDLKPEGFSYFSGENLKIKGFYKLYVSVAKTILEKSKECVFSINKNSTNDIFNNIGDNVYGLVCQSNYNNLYLTTDAEKYKKKIKEVRTQSKIIYYNNRTKGKDFFDIDGLKQEELISNLKNISYTDVYFKLNQSNAHDISNRNYDVYVKGFEKYNNNICSNPMFRHHREEGKVYFGKLRNRYHAGSIKYKGIGLGYKIYKAFVKDQGYIVSDMQTSDSARGVYKKLSQDSDMYSIAYEKGDKYTYDKDSQKIMLIWKTYPKLEKLLRLVVKNELKYKRKYIYDDGLTDIVSKIKKEVKKELRKDKLKSSYNPN